MSENDDLLEQLLQQFITNETGCIQTENQSVGELNCTTDKHHETSPHLTVGEKIFTYVTPSIFAVGIIGNIVSMRVFVTKNMRKLSASVYLAALSISDLMALVFYVLIEWIKRGRLTDTPWEMSLPFIEQNGMCQIIVYFQYISRFISAWIVVCFTFERYVGVCHPLSRKTICNVNSSRKIVATVIVVAFILCVYKPVLSAAEPFGPGNVLFCTAQKETISVSFILDFIFVISITFIPFVIITVLNTMIIRTLYIRNKYHCRCKVVTEESIIRLEFTVILIAISICFIAFNTPYSAVWAKQYFFIRPHQRLLDMTEAAEPLIWNINLHFITRTIFYMNYCVNFFLYCLTGAYFRKELQMLFTYRRKKPREKYQRCSIHNTTSTPQSCL